MAYFWFFRPENIEVVVKVLDACDINGHYWVFAGGLTDVFARLTVSDPVTGAEFVHENPLGNPFVPITNTEALAACR